MHKGKQCGIGADEMKNLKMNRVYPAFGRTPGRSEVRAYLTEAFSGVPLRDLCEGLELSPTSATFEYDSGNRFLHVRVSWE